MPGTHKYGAYTREQGWEIFSGSLRKLAQLQIYHLVNCLRAGDRPAECIPEPPPGRTLVEYAAAAWTQFHGRSFRDASVPGHHCEPEWLAFTAAIEARMARGRSQDVAALAATIYQGVASEAAERDIAGEWRTWDEPCPFGAFKYEDPHDGDCALHFHNVYMPESPFQDPALLFQSLRALIADMERRGLDVRRVGVDSWLNHVKPFQACFPPSFAASITPTTRDHKGGKGWWGQFIQRTGEFHEQRAERLRQTRQFDYRRAHAECSFDEFKAHVMPRA